MKHDPLTSLYTVWIPGKYGASRPGKWCEEDPVRAEIDKDMDEVESHILYESPACPSSLARRPGRISWMLQDFEVLDKISASRTCAVLKVKYYLTGSVFALKVFFKQRLTCISQHQLAREIEIHTRLNHPNIIPLVRLDYSPCNLHDNFGS
mmetsp:Transcript_40729/g.96851  ORF Transcript_40729/g.96851 Transcript_40729/m.96851 type:complete len:151 (+) Transcript_40729:115-567(+)